LLSRFHRPPELPLELLKPPVDGALGLPSGQALSWIAGLRTECIGCLQQRPQLVGPESAPIWGARFRQIAGEGRLVPSAAAIGPREQRCPQAQQQGEGGTNDHGALTHNSRRWRINPSLGRSTRL
jgi:hypothetical protein